MIILLFYEVKRMFYLFLLFSFLGFKMRFFSLLILESCLYLFETILLHVVELTLLM